MPYPPQTIISLPVHTAVWQSRAAGAPVVVTAVQRVQPPDCSARRRSNSCRRDPPQTIISLPVHTAV